MSSAVRFDARIPATWAVDQTSPLGSLPALIVASVRGFMMSSHRATAVRMVVGLALTSAMRTCGRAIVRVIILETVSQTRGGIPVIQEHDYGDWLYPRSPITVIMPFNHCNHRDQHL